MTSRAAIMIALRPPARPGQDRRAVEQKFNCAVWPRRAATMRGLPSPLNPRFTSAPESKSLVIVANVARFRGVEKSAIHRG